VTELVRTDQGAISISTGALARLVVQAAEQVDGARVLRPRRGLHVHVEDGSAHVALELAVQLGVVLPEVSRSVQERVLDALRTMLEVEVEAVDVSIEEIES
jgi:uncharacterized alkaline shock family protein YloU